MNAQTGEVANSNTPKPDAHVNSDGNASKTFFFIWVVIGICLLIAMKSGVIPGLLALVVLEASKYFFARITAAAENHSFPFDVSDGRTRMTLHDMGTILLVEDVKVDIDLANKNLPTGKAWEYDPDWQRKAERESTLHL